MRVPALTVAVPRVLPIARHRPERQPHVTVRPVLVMFVSPDAVTVSDRVVHRAMMPSSNLRIFRCGRS